MSKAILLSAALFALVIARIDGPMHAQTAPVTFADTIAPLVYDNCVTCHRPGEAAPFSLITYDDVRKRGAMIAKVTQSRFMPPWQATHGYGDFEGERRLTDEQIQAIAKWVSQGMPQGDPARMPPLPKFPEGWRLGTPDLVLQMPATFDIPASGPDVFRNFVIPSGLTEDKWVRAVEFRPSARRVVHHALYSYVRGGALKASDGADGRPGFPGLSPIGVRGNVAPAGPLGGWAVGASPRFFPDGVALPLAKGSDIVLQMHFHPTGKAEREQSTIGIYFADRAPERRVAQLQMPGLFGVGAGIDIPAGEQAYAINSSAVMPVDVRLYTASPHAHYLGKEFKATATLPDGSTRPLLWIQDWDFNWQDGYNYKQPVVLPKGTRIDVKIVYDNSAQNPRNPSSPPHRVWWGEQSTDEMGSIGFMLMPVRPEDTVAWQQFAAQWQRTTLVDALRTGTAERIREFRAGQGAGAP
jgi:hypothetical protein